MNDAVNPRPGFWGGFGSMFRAIGALLSRPACWPYALVPPLVLSVLATLLVFLAIKLVHPLVGGLLPQPESGLGAAGVSIVSWFAAILVALVGVLLALALTPPLSAPALERLVEDEERRLGAPARPQLGFFQEMWCGLRAQLFAAMFAIPLLTLLWIVELLFAPAAVVTIPLKFIVAAFSMAWNLFDYPLTLRGVRMRDRFSIVMKYKRETFGFGMAFAALFWLPCLGVVLLPVGVIAATKLCWRLLRSDPELLPGLARGTPPELSSDAARSPAPGAA